LDATSIDSGTLAELVAAAEAAADAAGAVIRPYFRSGLDADLKGDLSPVTAADRGAEQAMRKVLAQRFPAHGVLGEEFGWWRCWTATGRSSASSTSR